MTKTAKKTAHFTVEGLPHSDRDPIVIAIELSDFPTEEALRHITNALLGVYETQLFRSVVELKKAVLELEERISWAS